MPDVSRWFRTALLAGLVAAMVTPQTAVAQEEGDPVPDGAVVHDFAQDSLGPEWTVLAPDPSRYSLADGALRVDSLQGDTHQNSNSARNVFLTGIPDGDFEVVAKLSAEVSRDFQGASLLAWEDTDNYLRAGLAHVGFAGGVVIENGLEVDGAFSSTFTPRPGSTGETLRIQRIDDQFTTSYWDGDAWVEAATVTADLDVAYVGLLALSAQDGTPITAAFDYLAVRASEGSAVVPEGAFTLDARARTPYLVAGRRGNVQAVVDRPATRLVLRATPSGDAGDVVLTADDGRALAVGRHGALVLVDDVSAATPLRLVDAGAHALHLTTADGRFLGVHRGAVRIVGDDAAAATRFVLQPYAAGEAALSVDAGAQGKAISEDLYGIFYEDINWAADGGLYAEMVRNRSFEFSADDNDDYTALTAWSEVERGGSGGAIEVVGDDPLNGNNPSFLRVETTTVGSGADAAHGVRNTGFDAVHVDEGATYDVSLWARSPEGAVPVTVGVSDEAGTTSFGAVELTVDGADWTRYEAELVATGDTSDGRFDVLVGGDAGTTVDLDMVSVFPRDTFKGRENGLRRDIAEKIAELRPSFVRFPGGCIVNTFAYEPWPAGRRIYDWKDTVGPVEQRPDNANFWGYNQTYGLGFFEYFQFAEDLGAEPLPVVPAGVNGCGLNFRASGEALEPWIDNALDLIEFANGDPGTEWGAVRAEMGHPEPFDLKYLGIGNEESDPLFYENYPRFAAAIRAAYPEIKLISNSGPQSAGRVFDRSWQFAREQGADLVDEHYYNSPLWFLSNNDRYDDYDRAGPHVFIGEYASQGDTWFNALAEASYMTGIERNADVIDFASYAPLLSRIGHNQWFPNLIWYDNDEVYGSASYEVQRLFSHNAGDAVVPTTLEAEPLPGPGDITGGVGLATWETQAAYDDLVVTGADGEVLLSDDFSGDASQWDTQSGEWAIVDGEFVQSSGATDARAVAGDPAWSNYTMEVTARKLSGAEGFLVMFGVRDTGNWYWWNLGGFGNTYSLVERATNGAKSPVSTTDHTIETGRDYRIRIEVRGRQVSLYLDGELVDQFVDDVGTVEPLYHVATTDPKTGDVVIKVVNARREAVRTAVAVDGVRGRSAATVTTLTAESRSTVNSLGDPDAVAPRKTRLRLGADFTYDFPADSVTFIRMDARRRRGGGDR
jgi:alpha-L-arabinofuranosidase